MWHNIKEELIEKFENDVAKRSRFMRFLLAIDQTLNVIWLNGSQDETVSSHIARNIETDTSTWLQRLVCKGLRLLEAKHCLKSRGE